MRSLEELRKTVIDYRVLRVQVDESWSIPEFHSLLGNLQYSYSLIEGLRNTFVPLTLSRSEFMAGGLYASQKLRMAIHSLTIKPEDSGMTKNDWSLHELPEVALLPLLSASVPPLAIREIRMSSPGWIDVIGSLNPLKVIADFVTAYRAEDTKRMALGLRRESMQLNLLRDIYAMIPEGQREEYAKQIASVVVAVEESIFIPLESMAKQAKVVNVRLIQKEGE